MVYLFHVPKRRTCVQQTAEWVERLWRDLSLKNRVRGAQPNLKGQLFIHTEKPIPMQELKEALIRQINEAFKQVPPPEDGFGIYSA
ncbi:MAG: hypothetical protein ACI819_000879 [Neolewinella sp.]|jgi:hypothetical protein